MNTDLPFIPPVTIPPISTVIAPPRRVPRVSFIVENIDDAEFSVSGRIGANSVRITLTKEFVFGVLDYLASKWMLILMLLISLAWIPFGASLYSKFGAASAEAKVVNCGGS